MIKVSDLSVNSVSSLRSYSRLRSGGRLRWEAPQQHNPTPIMAITHEGGLSHVHAMFPWKQHQQGPRQTRADIRCSSGNACYLVRGFQCRCGLCSYTSPFSLFIIYQRLWLPVAAVSVLHCKASSTLNMSLLRLSHAKRKKRGGGRWESSSGDKSLLCSMRWC